MQVCWQSLNKHDEGISSKRAEENVKVLMLELVELWTKGSFYFKIVLMRQAFGTAESGGNCLDARPFGSRFCHLSHEGSTGKLKTFQCLSLFIRKMGKPLSRLIVRTASGP